jgi:hypothetical protein
VGAAEQAVGKQKSGRGGRVVWCRGGLGALAAAGKIRNFGSQGLEAKGTQEGEVEREGN